MAKIGMISLGCPKNQVDAELMLAKLTADGHEISGEISGCDIVIINVLHLRCGGHQHLWVYRCSQERGY